MKLYRDLRRAIAAALKVESVLNIDGVNIPVFARRTDNNSAPYGAVVSMGYLLTVLVDVDIAFLTQAIKQQSKGIYPVLTAIDSRNPQLFCINEFLTLADGAIALNGYVCYNRDTSGSMYPPTNSMI